MRILAISSLVSIVLFSVNGISQINQLSEKNKFHVFRVEVYKEGKKFTGSAFAVSYEDGILNLVTAKHVIAGYDSMKVCSYQGKCYRVDDDRQHPNFDIAYLSIECPAIEMPLEADNAALSDKVSFIRVKDDWKLIQETESQGYIEAIKSSEIQIKNFPTADDDSGGPVYVGNAIIGMVSRTGIEGYKQFTYLISMNTIHGVLDDWKIPWQTHQTEIQHAQVTPLVNNPGNSIIKLSQLQYLTVSKMKVTNGCSDDLYKMTDGNTQTAWKCSNHGPTDIYFYFPDKVAIRGFSIYQEGDTNDTNEEIPDGNFEIEGLNIELSLSKLMRNKNVTDTGKWVNYELKEALITSSFSLHLYITNVYAAAIYEIKLKGYLINQ